MATSLHIGKHRVVTITSSDGSTIPLGSLTATPGQAFVTASVDPATNAVTVTGVSAGTASVTYAAPGYVSVFETFTVSPLPSLIFTDGPET